MKKLMILLIIPVLLNSCIEDWLDVTPKTDVNQEQLFRNEAGFRSALYGVYLAIGEKSMYGANLTMEFTDVLAQYYNISLSTHPFYAASRYDYNSEDVKGTIAQVWEDAYNAIANLNNLLEHLEKKESDFFSDPRYYNILKGESMALRAMLHFDLLRLVGPSPVTAATQKAIPFVDKVSKVPFEQLTVAEMIQRCLSELGTAAELLYEVDPISPKFEEYTDKTIVQGNQNEYINDGGFFLQRRSRLNYLAVRGLMARVALYGGDKEKAATYAEECMLSGRADPGKSLFELHIDRLYLNSQTYFNSNSTPNNGLLITNANRRYYYESDLYGADTRPGSYFVSDGSYDIMSKFMKKQTDVTGPQYMPMITASEVYLIYAESAAQESDRYEAINNERAQFNLVGSDELTPGNQPDLENELFKEYRKRFIGEGVLFYYLKRKNITQVPRANGEQISIDAAKAYNMMQYLPQDEYDYGKIN